MWKNIYALYDLLNKEECIYFIKMGMGSQTNKSEKKKACTKKPYTMHLDCIYTLYKLYMYIHTQIKN